MNCIAAPVRPEIAVGPRAPLTQLTGKRSWGKVGLHLFDQTRIRTSRCPYRHDPSKMTLGLAQRRTRVVLGADAARIAVGFSGRLAHMSDTDHVQKTLEM